MIQPELSDTEFGFFQALMYESAGIFLTPAKKHLVASRLGKRIRLYELASFGAYYQHICDSAQTEERQIAIDLLTTNETYFFREPKHFEVLKQLARAHPAGQPFRVWSAASSSGEEAYSIAMVLADILGERPWEIIGTDICMRVLSQARQAHYPMTRIEGIPKGYLERFCLKGIRHQEGTFLVSRALRERVHFYHLNLNGVWNRELGTFDMIFLRNVMIYFDQTTKERLVARLLPYLKPRAHFLVGHAESLNGLNASLQTLAPSIYQKSS